MGPGMKDADTGAWDAASDKLTRRAGTGWAGEGRKEGKVQISSRVFWVIGLCKYYCYAEINIESEGEQQVLEIRREPESNNCRPLFVP